MEGLRESHLPTRLYRVQYPGCQTVYSPESGLSAGDTTTTPSNTEQLGDFVRKSFTWGSQIANPFINLFSDREHAVSWAISESQRTDVSYLVISIDTSNLERSRIFKLSTVVRELNILIPEGARSHLAGAYLCLHEIPSGSILSVEISEELSAEREARRWAREEFVDHSICRPGTHWNGELYGYYSTDEEVEECNMNGDLERMMDDMWD